MNININCNVRKLSIIYNIDKLYIIIFIILFEKFNLNIFLELYLKSIFSSSLFIFSYLKVNKFKNLKVKVKVHKSYIF